MLFNMDESTQRAITKFPHRALDIVRSFERNKIDAKLNLVTKLRQYQQDNRYEFPKKNYNFPSCFERVNIIGGWYGNVIIPLLDTFINYKGINFYEVDEEALSIAQNIYFPDRHDIKWICKDATEVVYDGIGDYGTGHRLTINTSCEHMNPLNIKKGIVALQSNNYKDVKDHVNCVGSPEELIEQYNFNRVFYKNAKKYSGKKKDGIAPYDRFTVIGRIENEDQE